MAALPRDFPPELTLSGLHAVVTGGGSGIGASVAEQLLAQGASLTLMGRRLDKLASQAEKMTAFGGANVQVQVPVQVRSVDVGDEDSVAAAFADIGKVDVLVNNAGQAETAPLGRTSMAMWQRMLQVNLTGTFLCSRAVVGGMSERGFGRIINVASTAGLSGYAYVAAYCAAKHGVIGLTRAMAQEFAKKGVTVNAVCPGYTETEIVDAALANIMAKTGRTAEQARADLAAGNPQGRLVQPDEVATAVLWLAQRGSAAVNGQTIVVSGGEKLA